MARSVDNVRHLAHTHESKHRYVVDQERLYMRLSSLLVAAVLVGESTPLLAQNLGEIVGVVRDQSGSSVAGVTIEASSPALIEGRRTTTSGTSGEYRIVDLRPGDYSVTFTHEGFRAMRRENVRVESSFTVTINADLTVGQTAQEMTVSDAPPLDDVQNSSGIPFQGTPQAKNTIPYDGRSQCQRCGTCDICPTGARYSPDFTFKRLLAEKKITLHDNTLIRKLVLDDTKPVIVAARGVNSERPADSVEYRAKTFVVASRSAHLGCRTALAAIEGFRRPHPARRRPGKGLAIEKQSRYGARQSILRRAPGRKQRVDARSLHPEQMG
jgi:ferredoxin